VAAQHGITTTGEARQREVSMRVILRFSIHHNASPRSIRWNPESAGGNCLAGRNTLRGCGGRGWVKAKG
jgi:hypothetical protein